MLHSPDELRLVIQHVQLDPGARRLIDRVFDYTHRVARHVMTLRRDVVTLTAGIPFDDNLRIALANQYTRYPLVEPGTDRVVGYIHLKDIVSALASGKRPAFMRELVREPIYASDDTRLEWLRREFQRRRVHIAIILGPGPHVRRHRDAGGSAGGGGRRDPGRAGRRGDPADRAQRRRQLRGRRAADPGRRGARHRHRVPGGPAAGRDAGRLRHHRSSPRRRSPATSSRRAASASPSWPCATAASGACTRCASLPSRSEAERDARERHGQRRNGRNAGAADIEAGGGNERRCRSILFADVVCPWCFSAASGSSACSQSLGQPARVTHHPFLLDPNTPPEGDDVPARLRRKYGVPPEQLWARLEAEARKSDLELDLSKQRWSYPTARAHTLHPPRRGEGDAARRWCARSTARTSRRRATSTTTAVLADVAAPHGFDADEVARLTARRRRARRRRARRRGPQRPPASTACRSSCSASASRWRARSPKSVLRIGHRAGGCRWHVRDAA